MLESTPPESQSYQVIARRYRPRFFQEVVGQEAIAETLRQALLQNRLAHAYLFSGRFLSHHLLKETSPGSSTTTWRGPKGFWKRSAARS